MEKAPPKNTYEVLGIGSSFLDIVVRVSEEYLASVGGEKGGMQPVDYKTFINIIENSGSTPHVVAGGSAANTLKGLSHFGHTSALFGKIGKDAAGSAFLDSIKKLQIIPLLQTTETPTGQIVCLITPDGERTLRDFLGASQEMNAADLTPTLFEGVKLVHIEGYNLMYKDLVARAIELSKKAGALVSLDLATFEIATTFKNEIISLGGQIDILFANKDEVFSLTKLGAEKGCAVLKDIFKLVVVTMGKEGCWIGSDQELKYYPAYPVPPLDSTGAGDLFASGFLHGYLTGKKNSECAHIGAITAAEVVQVYGAEIPEDRWQKVHAKIAEKSLSGA